MEVWLLLVTGWYIPTSLIKSQTTFEGDWEFWSSTPIYSLSTRIEDVSSLDLLLADFGTLFLLI